MAGRRRLYAASSFVLNIFSLIFIVISAATDCWVKADVFRENNSGRFDSLHYGLYGGKVEFAEALNIRHNLHMVCVLPGKACAVTCKTTPDARRQEVIHLATGYRPASLRCDDNRNFNHNEPHLEGRPVIPKALYVAINIFLYLQLLYTLCSAVLALVNILEDHAHPLLGFQAMAMTSCACAVKGAAVLLFWGIYFSASQFQSHLAFAYVAAQTTQAFAAVGYSYWLLLIAVLFSLSSTVLIVFRIYFERKGIL